MFHDPLRRTKLSLKLFYQIELTLTSYIGLSAQAAVMYCFAHPKQPLIDILLVWFVITPQIALIREVFHS